MGRLPKYVCMNVESCVCASSMSLKSWLIVTEKSKSWMSQKNFQCMMRISSHTSLAALLISTQDRTPNHDPELLSIVQTYSPTVWLERLFSYFILLSAYYRYPELWYFRPIVVTSDRCIDSKLVWRSLVHRSLAGLFKKRSCSHMQSKPFSDKFKMFKFGRQFEDVATETTKIGWRRRKF